MRLGSPNRSPPKCSYRLAKKGVDTAWGTDTLFSAEVAVTQGARLAKQPPAYPGRLGIVEQGALADLLLVDGVPLDEINLVAEPKSFVVIMKDAKI
jgi:imidazolonepropionase-like amidohydrolase